MKEPSDMICLEATSFECCISLFFLEPLASASQSCCSTMQPGAEPMFPFTLVHVVYCIFHMFGRSAGCGLWPVGGDDRHIVSGSVTYDVAALHLVYQLGFRYCEPISNLVMRLLVRVWYCPYCCCCHCDPCYHILVIVRSSAHAGRPQVPGRVYALCLLYRCSLLVGVQVDDADLP